MKNETLFLQALLQWLESPAAPKTVAGTQFAETEALVATIKLELAPDTAPAQAS